MTGELFFSLYLEYLRLFMFIDHRIIERFGLEGTLKII